MIVRRSDLFNDNSICIFTDSSYRNNSLDKRVSLGTTAPSICVYRNFSCIDQKFNILHNTTSQQGELYALLMGIMESYKYREFENIRIFSDSLSSVLAVRDRIFTWVRNKSKYLGKNGSIKNQDMIMDIIYYIISNNIHIELYHIKGHVDPRNTQSFLHAKNTFINSNIGYYTNIDDALIYQLAFGNDMVDKFSTHMLLMNNKNEEYDYTRLPPAITIGYAPFDMRNYFSLVNAYGMNDHDFTH